MWWLIPLLITILSIRWALRDVLAYGDIWSGISAAILLIPALIVSMLSWIAYALLK